MEEIKIEVNDKVIVEIMMAERVCIINGYCEDCVMTITFPEDWSYTRVVQHALSIAQASMIEGGKIV